MSDKFLTNVFHFDPTERFYLGNDKANLCPLTGVPDLPAHATFQAPPTYSTNEKEIAIFISEEEGWTVVENNFWRPNITRRSILLGNSINGQLDIVQIEFFRITKFGCVRVLNPATVGLAMSGRLAYMQTRVKEIAQIDNDFRSKKMMCPSSLHHFKYATEDLVIQMKRFVDEIFMHEWIRLESRSDDFLSNKIIRVKAVNEIDKQPKGNTRDYLEAMKNNDTLFFETLIDLRNSFAHHLTVASSYNLMGADFPTVNTVYMKHGNLNNMELIDVYIEDLVKSFNRFVITVFGIHSA
ncbi:MAG: hypothetical protein NTW85_03360 [Methylococcales bacterium]|nr:hypothetical protein [Methylococcales bacterium]